MKYNLAIIGYGGMGSWHHGCIREKISELNVKGAYDIRPEIQQKIIQNGLNAYQNIEELLNDSSIDIVTIAVPNNFHKDYAVACLKAGKNVVCEKPVTMNAAELEEIIARFIKIVAGTRTIKLSKIFWAAAQSAPRILSKREYKALAGLCSDGADIGKTAAECCWTGAFTY